MGRCWAWLALGAVAGYAVACGDVAAFACQSDADCVLTGTPGLCDAGKCAYPDQDCPSGFSYPAATPGLGGECVPGDAATGTTGGSADTRSDGGSGSADDGATTFAADGSGGGTLTGGTSIGGATSSPPTATTSDDGTDGGSTTGGNGGTGLACLDEHGDTIFAGTGIPGCEAMISSHIVDSEDNDWFGFFGPGGDCEEGEYVATIADPDDAGLMVCIFAGCEGGAASVAQCMTGAPGTAAGFQGCCSDVEVRGDFLCPDTPTDDLDPFVVVFPQVGAGNCSPYVIDVAFAEPN